MSLSTVISFEGKSAFPIELTKSLKSSIIQVNAQYWAGNFFVVQSALVQLRNRGYTLQCGVGWKDVLLQQVSVEVPKPRLFLTQAQVCHGGCGSLCRAVSFTVGTASSAQGAVLALTEEIVLVSHVNHPFIIERSKAVLAALEDKA